MNVPYKVIPAVEEFIKQVKPQKLLLTHFNSDILKANPVLIAKELSKKYNLEVIAVQDDMIFYLWVNNINEEIYKYKNNINICSKKPWQGIV